jgi:hypothetical protein
VFNQTQRALRANASQTDPMEGGRFAMALLVTDLRNLTAAGVTPETNFLAALSPAINVPLLSALRMTFQPVLCRRSPVRLERLSPGRPDLERLQRAPRTSWGGVPTTHQGSVRRGWRIVFSMRGVGWGPGAVRVRTYEPLRHAGPAQRGLPAAPAASFAQVLDGLCISRCGRMTAGLPDDLAESRLVRGQQSAPEPGYQLGVDLLEQDPRVSSETLAMYRSNALPAAIEIEIGILEPESLAQFRRCRRLSVRGAVLSNRAAQVQLFRQRVLIWQAPPLQSAQSVRP